MAIEIVDFPIKHGWIFHCYVSLPEGIPESMAVFVPQVGYDGYEYWMRQEYGRNVTQLVHRFSSQLGAPHLSIASKPLKLPGFQACAHSWILKDHEFIHDNENKKSTSTQANKDRKKEEKKTSSTTAFN